MPTTLWYSRCPVATASGIAYQRGMFDAEFDGSDYEVRNIKDLGRDKANIHFTGAQPNSFREGGFIPPLWAHQNGSETTVIGFTFVAETLRFYVRPDSGINSFADLKGKRIGLPVRPKLEIDFMHVNAHKAFWGALQEHGMTEDDVQMTDIEIGDDVLGTVNADYGQGDERTVPPLYAGEIEALLAGEVDVVFAKNAEALYTEHVYDGRIKMIYDLIDSEKTEFKCNANPRPITVSTSTLSENPEAVIRYLQVLIRASAYAAKDRQGAAETMAPELGVQTDDILNAYEADFNNNLWPTLDESIIGLANAFMKFMVDKGYLSDKVTLDGWVDPEPLREAYRREKIAYAA
jgi:ABC-type nitrate/sulfonate/bicarbonate transport system substrate-binding protein